MTMDDPSAIRIFISSTFRDMQAERDLLAKHVFPKLRRLCEQRGATLVDVDLRWGITEEQSHRGETLPLCLAEIERCRPFFVCMLGERYGWVPAEVPADLVDRQPWLREHREHSVTALEIVHGVFQNPAHLGNALFYFRDPAYVATLPEDERPAFREGPTADDVARYGRSEADRLATQRSQALTNLKDRIRASGARLHEGYANPAEFARRVTRDLAALIEPHLPGVGSAHPLDRESDAHVSFARSRAKGYVPCPEERSRLRAFLSGDEPALAVSGVSGSGKSSLLAAWFLELTASAADHVVVPHFVAATPTSTNWEAMVGRLLRQMQRALGDADDPPRDTSMLRQAFADALCRIAERGRCVLLIDAVDQLDDREGARELAWLPVALPKGVKIVISTLEGATLDAVHRREWPVVELGPLDAGRKRDLVAGFLSRYSKALDEPRMARVIAAPQTNNPLFLRTMLEELRLIATHESLDGFLDRYLAAADTTHLFELVLSRWEKDYAQGRPGWVRTAMRHLGASRRGLSEAELLALTDDEPARLPRLHLSHLIVAANHFLVSRSGLLGFFHRAFGEAVRRRYLADDEVRRQTHRRLAGFFARSRNGRRKLDEMPWQLARAGEWQRLAIALKKPAIFIPLWDDDAYEVQSLWADVEQRSGITLARSCRKWSTSPEANPPMANRVALLLSATGHAREALRILLSLEELFERRGEEESLQAIRGNVAITQMHLGETDAAFARFQEIYRQAVRREDHDQIISSLSNMSEVLLTQGLMDDAESMCVEQERRCREKGDADGLFRALGKRGHIVCLRQDWEKAGDYFREAEMLSRQVGDRAGIAAALTDQAFMFREAGKLSLAMKLYSDAEAIARSINAPAQLHGALGGRATLHEMQGENDQAMALYVEAERIGRMSNDDSAVFKAIHHQSLLWAEKGETRRALDMQREAEAICRSLADLHGLYRSLGCQGIMHQDLGDHEKALSLARQAGAICDQLGDVEGKIGSLAAEASVLAEQGDVGKASVLHDRVVQMRRQRGKPHQLAVALLEQAAFAWERLQNRSQATTLAEESLALAERFSFEDMEHAAREFLAQLEE